VKDINEDWITGKMYLSLNERIESGYRPLRIYSKCTRLMHILDSSITFSQVLSSKVMDLSIRRKIIDAPDQYVNFPDIRLKKGKLSKSSSYL